MKKLMTVLLLVSSMVWARNAIPGNRGTFRVYSGRCEDQGMLSLNLFHLEGYYQDPLISGGAHSSLSFTPASPIEFSIFGSGFGWYDVNTSDYKLPTLYAGGLNLKLGYPFWLNQQRTIFIAPGALGVVDYEGDTLNSWLGMGGKGLLSFGVQPVALHINGGYITDYDMDAGTFENPSVPLGVGLEVVPIPYLSLITEFHYLAPAEDFGAAQMWLSPGIRVSTSPLAGVTFNLGVEVGLGDRKPFDWNGIFGMSVAFDLIRPPHIPLARLSGRIIDRETSQPIQATLSFPGSDLAAIQNDPATGEYEITASPGVYRVHVEALDYRWVEKGVSLKDGDDLILDFDLAQRKVPKAVLAGKVMDYQSNRPIASARVSFPGAELEPVTTDGAGIFKVTLPPGTYSVKAEAEGYIEQTLPVVLAEDAGKELTFSLLPHRIRLERVHFAPGSAAIEPSSYPALDQAVRLLRERPKLRIEIQGHTDSVGSAASNLQLSQRRAEAVRNYLIQQGVESDRLIARGYGESMPIGDNRTIEGQRLNRRIEFVILGER
jgi:outer membrane protein OmpA-like peptidoglycan-associated protein